MPIKKSAEKALRQNIKRARVNKQAKDSAKKFLKDSRSLIETGSVDEAKELVKKTLKVLDKLAGRGILKKNTVARKKSRLMLKLNKQLKNK